MQNAIGKVFLCGRSQAVRIPQEFRFQTDEVTIVKQGNSLVLTPREASLPWKEFFQEPICPDFEFKDAKIDFFPAKELF